MTTQREGDPSNESRTRPFAPEIPGPTPDRPTHGAEGVDLTLLRWFRTLTPTERLLHVQSAVNSLETLRRAPATPLAPERG